MEIRELPTPAAVGAPGWDDLLARTALFNELAAEVVDGPDLQETPEETLSWLTDPDTSARTFGAYDHDQLFGFGEFATEADKHVGWFWVGVARDHRRAGIGSRLAARLYACAREAGITVLETGADHADFDGGKRLRSPVSPASVPASAPSVRFLLSQSFELGQVEVNCSLPLPIDEDHLTELLASARPADDYDVADWTGRTPEPFIAGYARLRTLISTALPSGEMETDVDRWDAERVRTSEATNTVSTTVTTVAVHRPTGELVAFTKLGYPKEPGHPAGQGYTFVLPEHRGHNLGLRIKINNLRRLNEADHHAPRIGTLVADENDAMSAINRALGFRPFVLRSVWQKRLAD